MFKKSFAQFWFICLIIFLGYFATHLPALTKLPVFADEAIYIRWTQLMIDDFNRYAFFPLNDGKTPLQMWLTIPFQLLPLDALFSARLLIVIVGSLQVAVMGWIAWLLSKSRRASVFAMLATTILPYWYFHHRMFLLDGMMTLFISAAWGFFILAQQSIAGKKQQLLYFSTALAGTMLGLSLLTKLPAILAFPSFAITVLWHADNYKKLKKQTYLLIAVSLGTTWFIGLALFALLKLHPAFGQLFSRGSDFLFPVSAILAGAWQQTIISIPTYISYFGNYFTWIGLGFLIVGLFSRPHQKNIHISFWSAVIFALPIMLMGRVVYPRYLMPAILWLTIGLALSIESVFVRFKKITDMRMSIIIGLGIAVLLASLVSQSSQFIVASMSDVSAIPFVEADQQQYLTEWSAGFGNTEAVAFIMEASKSKSIAVGTEGYFGTLPDGLTMYFHQSDVSNLYIDGVGYPIKDFLPATFVDRAKEFDEVWIVANSHRIDVTLPEEDLLLEVCRPFNAPCLQIWNVTDTLALKPR